MDFQPVRERRRSASTKRSARSTLTQNGVLTSDALSSFTMWDVGYIMDRNNTIDLLGTPRGAGLDIGGPLMSIQVTNDFPAVSQYISSGPVFGSNVWTVTGDLMAYPQYVNTSVPDLKGTEVARGFGGIALDPLITRIGLGATAISRCKPASPEASFGTFLAETYREGIPGLLSQLDIRSQTAYFRSLGDNYLRVEFGWKPFVSELIKTTRALQRSQSILEDLRRNSGKRLRRRYEFPTQESSTLRVTDDVRPWPTPNSYVLSQQKRTITTTMKKRTWFEGEFVYRFPLADDPFPQRWKAELRQIVGLDFTPETLWNIAPWTWLLDWGVNIGDVMSNVSAISDDDLTMRYGYLMQEAIRKDIHTHHNVKVPRGSVPSQITGTVTSSVKSRISASPYGFGTKWSDLSLRQAAILASLGFTQSGRWQG